MRRRTFFKITALLAATTAAGGCTSTETSDSGKVELTFWSWVPEIGKAVDQWNSTHPDVQVRLNAVPGGSQGTYTKMYAAVKAGNAPDIGQIEFSYLPNFAQLGDVQDISEYVGAETRAQFPDWTIAQVSSGSALYAVPQDIAPMGLFYRKDLFAEAGITSPPATWQDFAKAAEALRKAEPTRRITNFATNQADWFAGLTWQAGGSWFGQDGDEWTVGIDSPEARRTAEFWQDLVDRDLVSAENNWSEDWNKKLQNGGLAAWIGGAWGGPTLAGAAAGTEGKWAVAPLPQWEGTVSKTGNWGGSTNVVMTGSKHPAEAAAFIQWLNTDPTSTSLLGKGSGLFMAARSWRESESYNAPFPFFDGQRIYQVLGGQEVGTEFRWGPTVSDTVTAFQDATGKVASGTGTITDALTAAQTKALTTMKDSGFPVSGS